MYGKVDGDFRGWNIFDGDFFNRLFNGGRLWLDGGGLSGSLNLGADFGQLRGILSKNLQLGQSCPCLLGHAVRKVEANLVDDFVGFASFTGDGNFMVVDGVSDLDFRGFGSGRGAFNRDGVVPFRGKVNLGRG